MQRWQKPCSILHCCIILTFSVTHIHTLAHATHTVTHTHARICINTKTHVHAFTCTHTDSTCPVCISSISIPECTATTCPSFPGTDDVMSPQLIPSPSPQATPSPSPQATSPPSPQATSPPRSPGTDSTTAPPTCSCSIEAIVITGLIAGISGIAITLTVVVIVAVIRRRRTSYKLKDLNMR